MKIIQSMYPHETHSVELMHQGMRLLADKQTAEAIDIFDEVIALRTQWSWQRDEHAAWMLAGAWMNRAEALLQEAGGAVVAASEAQQRAVDLLTPFVRSGSEETLRRWLLAQIEGMTSQQRLGNLTRAQELLASMRCWIEDQIEVNRLARDGELRLMLETRAVALQLECANVVEARACLQRAEALLPWMDTPWNRLHVQAARCRMWAKQLDSGEDLTEFECRELPLQLRDTVALALQVHADDAYCAEWLRLGSCWHRRYARVAMFSYSVACVEWIRRFRRHALLRVVIEQWQITKREWTAQVMVGACVPSEVRQLTHELSRWQVLEQQLYQWLKGAV